jgi:hypothetical protein
MMNTEIIPTAPARRRHLLMARAAAVLCLAMFLVTALQMARDEAVVSAAGTLQGPVSFRNDAGAITTGGSAAFTLTLPTGAACSGAGSAGYRWETFLVAATVDPGAITWGLGPAPSTSPLVTAVYSADGEQVSSKFPAGNPAGLISGIPQLSLSNTVSTGQLAVGSSYQIGIACTLNNQTEKWWATTLAITANTADTPLGIRWTVGAPPTSTTTTTSTTVAPTTTVRPTTTTTAGTTTTTTAASTTTTSVASSAATTTTAVSSGSGIPNTGTRTWVLAGWGLAALFFGRIALLMSRPIRVLPPKR